MKNILKKWQDDFNINYWQIELVPISDDQVTYPDDIDEEDRYFIGIKIDSDNLFAEIFHTRELKESDIVHELLHLILPSATESSVNILTDLLLIEEKLEGLELS